MSRHGWVIILLLITLMVAPQLAWAEGTVVGATFPISWTASPSLNLREYRIYIRTAQGAYDRTRYLPVPATDTTVDGAALKLQTDGQYFLVMTAVSLAAGAGESADSNEVPFVRQTTTPGPDVTPPLIAIQTPTAGAVVPRNTTLMITIDASDNVGITRMGVTVDGQTLPGCVLFHPPWRCPWKIPGAANKRYTINALAIDARGNNAQSQVEVIAK